MKHDGRFANLVRWIGKHACHPFKFFKSAVNGYVSYNGLLAQRTNINNFSHIDQAGYYKSSVLDDSSEGTIDTLLSKRDLFSSILTLASTWTCFELQSPSCTCCKLDGSSRMWRRPPKVPSNNLIEPVLCKPKKEGIAIPPTNIHNEEELRL